MTELSAIPPRRRFLLECSGACGDLGTFIPHVIGAVTVSGLAPAGVLFGFAAFLIATGLFYGLPLPVQPMKAISAVILTGGLRPGEVTAAGIMIGVVLLVLGITGWIGRLARAIPQSVSAGLQLGLGAFDRRAGPQADPRNPMARSWVTGAAVRLDPRSALPLQHHSHWLPPCSPDGRRVTSASRRSSPSRRVCRTLSCRVGRKSCEALRSRCYRSSR
jgi:hypothetical protein